MMANLSVKNVPENVLVQLRARAKRHHRSLQGELLTILEEAAGPRKLNPEEAEQRLQALNLRTPDESTAWIREDRSAR